MMRYCFILIPYLISFCATGKISQKLVEKASETCCPRNYQACCQDLIAFGKPIGCGFERDSKIPVQIYTCLQNELFAEEPEKRMNFDDAICCSVFNHDFNDPSHQCENTCRQLMSAPSVDAATRLERIKGCNLVENPLYECFTNCRHLHSKNKSIRVLHFPEYCNLTLTWKRRHRQTAHQYLKNGNLNLGP